VCAWAFLTMGASAVVVVVLVTVREASDGGTGGTGGARWSVAADKDGAVSEAELHDEEVGTDCCGGNLPYTTRSTSGRSG
jgi:hypothetical protein